MYLLNFVETGKCICPLFFTNDRKLLFIFRAGVSLLMSFSIPLPYLSVLFTVGSFQFSIEMCFVAAMYRFLSSNGAS